MSLFGRIELLNLAEETFGVRVRDFLPLGLIGTISATLFLLDGLRKVQLESEPKGNITSLEPGLMQNWIAASLLSCCLAGIFNRMAAMSGKQKQMHRKKKGRKGCVKQEIAPAEF